MFNFTVKEFILGSGTGTHTLQFYKRGFELNGNGSQPSWQDIILSGNTALTLVNSKANGLNYVKLFGECEQRNLPSEYTQVEYLESDGNQYIDTGIVLKSEATITTVAQANSFTNAGPFTFWGFMGSDTLPRWGWSIYQNRWLSDLNITSQSSLIPFADTQKHTFVNTCYYVDTDLYYNSFVDGNSVFASAQSVLNATLYTSNALSAYLFARNNNGTVGNLLPCRIFSYEIVQDGVKVLSLVPCRRNSDNVLGMYDTVSGQFFTNAVAGTFTSGADAVPSPDTPVDIVSNNGVLKFGYKSVNMFDKNSTLEDGVVWVNNGNTRPLSDYYGTNQIHVIGGHTYTRSGSHGNANYIKLSDETWATFNDGARTITMPDNAILWAFNNTTATSRDTMMVVEGTSLPAEYVPYEGYGIYTDGTVETVQVHGKNLWNPDGINYGWISSDGSFGIANGVSRRIEIKYGKTYTYKSYSAEGNFYNCVALYDANMNFISGSRSIITTGTTKTNTKTITNSSAKYMVCAYYISGGNIAPDQNMIYEGLMDIDYTPYFNGGTATAEMLLSVGNYKDVQSVLDGNVTRNVGIKVFDGTENWDTGSSAYSNRFTLAGAFNDIAQIPNENVGYSNCYTVIARSTSIQQNLQNNECGWNTTYVFCLRDDRFTTVAQLKQWLQDQYNAGTPVIIVYPLATATTETVTGQPLSIQAGTNIVEITQASIDNLELEVSYKVTA